MFHILLINNDPMGGGPAYMYVNSFRTIHTAKRYVKDEIERYDGPIGWGPKFIISKEVG